MQFSFKFVACVAAALASVASVNAVFLTDRVIGKQTTIIWTAKETDAPTDQRIFITLHKGDTWPASYQVWTDLPAHYGHLVTDLKADLAPGDDYWLRVVEIRDDSFDFARETSDRFSLTAA